MEHNYRYNKYDYANIGIKKKIFLQKMMSDIEYQVYINVFRNDTTKMVNHLADLMKANYSFSQQLKNSDFNPNDYNWEWKIITPNETYSSNEASN